MTSPMHSHPDDARLHDRLDGVLAPDDAVAVDQHLAACASCRDRLARFEALARRISEMPREILPAHDLWPALRGRLEPRTEMSPAATPRQASAFGVSWRAAAAAIALVAASSAATVALVRRDRSAAAPPVVAAAPDEPSGMRLPDERIPVAQAVPIADYEAAAHDLAAQLAARRDHLSPSTVATVERSLRSIDAAIAEARNALAHDPTNVVLTSMLNSNYTLKISLLRRATELTAGT